MNRNRPRLAHLASTDALPDWALMGAAAGLLAGLPFLPPTVRGLLLGAFVLVGPGAAILSWARTLPDAAVPALVPMVGIAVVLIVTAVASLTGAWAPRLTLYVLAVAVAVCAVIARRRRGTAVTV